ncbi:maleylpyruvate isomerase family mycothiol-dependent enzyme [Knoellia subterranea]|uniref:Mycothiol-dependent maleylpyruvate isomerase metal-binding domain-containing protein n=1 Tax=Knoellia subterranea KCTC 19937 TaxID=1385521 RepID=A0A0A0JRB8_9MICO|nr:maleylpyruvate isomerase family mycothiol-dependent enzyme [Knoellia subterranea]KGN38126.1 hypothetical protein N803_10190 [Knoellia subterranea KCTC 19937]
MRLEDHLAGLSDAIDHLAARAEQAGLDAPVPTCPDWTVRDLVTHQGMVHRWATALVVGDDAVAADPAALEAAGLASTDPLSWFRMGGARLLQALEQAPADLDALVFLKNAPPARQFWARRQCHETTIHAADALSARTSRMPSAHLANLDAPLAADGIDELLTGFLPRSKSRLRSDDTVRIAVCPSDVEQAWLVTVSEGPPVSTRHTREDVELRDAEVTFSGTAAELYLGLWNRGDEITTNDADELARWRALARVQW